MTELDILENAIIKSNKMDLIEWLIDFAYWFDPGGYVEPKDIEKYLETEVKVL